MPLDTGITCIAVFFFTPSHGYSTPADGSQAIESFLKSFARFVWVETTSKQLFEQAKCRKRSCYYKGLFALTEPNPDLDRSRSMHTDGAI